MCRKKDLHIFHWLVVNIHNACNISQKQRSGQEASHFLWSVVLLPAHNKVDMCIIVQMTDALIYKIESNAGIPRQLMCLHHDKLLQVLRQKIMEPPLEMPLHWY